MDKKKNRPRYLNLIKISMPVAAVVSIGHRISGFLLVIAIPFLIYAFQLSVSSAEEYAQVVAAIEHPLMLVIIALLVWSFSHHFFAGIRFLLIDIDIGVTKEAASAGAWVVHALAILTALSIVGALL
ncbi:succinate dehydrogenase, cytochrome b556 subunit [Kaarinaea lacus]